MKTDHVAPFILTLMLWNVKSSQWMKKMSSWNPSLATETVKERPFDVFLLGSFLKMSRHQEQILSLFLFTNSCSFVQSTASFDVLISHRWKQFMSGARCLPINTSIIQRETSNHNNENFFFSLRERELESVVVKLCNLVFLMNQHIGFSSREMTGKKKQAVPRKKSKPQPREHKTVIRGFFLGQPRLNGFFRSFAFFPLFSLFFFFFAFQFCGLIELFWGCDSHFFPSPFSHLLGFTFASRTPTQWSGIGANAFICCPGCVVVEETHFEPGNCLHSSIPLIWLFRSGFNAMAAHVNPIKPLVAIPKDPARSSFTVVTPEIWAHRDVPMDEDDGFVHVCFSSSSHWEGSSSF